METFKTEILARIEANQNTMTKRIEILERENFDLRKINDEMTKSIKETTQTNKEIEERLNKIENQTKKQTMQSRPMKMNNTLDETICVSLDCTSQTKMKTP